MMKKYNYYLVFFLLMFFGQIQAGIYPNYTQSISVPSLNYTGQSGTGGGTISVTNDVLTINISATWASLSYLNYATTVATLTISPALPNMELGQLSSAPGNPLANFAAKIQDNKLIFYLTNPPTQWYGCYFSYTKNLACDVDNTWYLDDDLDGLGDPLNFLTHQCSKPPGNYVLDNTDNCPMIPGTNANCASLEAALQNQNSIKNITYKVATGVSLVNPTIAQANQNITYFDGLGRPIQKIAYQASASGKDIVTPIVYDGYGRETREYLPYASTQNNLNYINPLTLIPNIVTQYQTNYGAANNNPFSEKQLEASPLSRVLQQAAPGSDWALANNHTVKMDYQTNADTDYVQNFVANASWNPTLELYDIGLTKAAGNGFYTSNKLYKTITYDENTAASPLEVNGSTVEFKNKEGQVILKRTYGIAGAGTSNEKHDTYYVYDTFGNLTYVIPPKATDLMVAITPAEANLTSTAVTTSGNALQLKATNSITLSTGFNAQSGSTFSAVIDNSNQTVLDNLCYQYKYDSRNRLVEKKLPGKQWEFIVYDKLDRPVATGPANSPFNDITSVGWIVTKYDALNRPVLTAWLPATATTITAADRKTLQVTQNNITSNFSETKITAATNTTINGVAFRYSTVAWPLTGYHVLTVSYFDDYNYQNAPTAFPAIETQVVFYNNTAKPTGLATGNWTRILENSTAYRNELSYTFYDEKARPIRTFTQNFLGGSTYTDSKLDLFSGQLQYSITKHKRLSTDTEITTKDAFTYSAQDCLLTQTHQINSGTIEPIVSNTYDELGQLVSKNVGNVQTVDYTYNIRGWLKGINDITTINTAGNTDLFAFRVNYNDPTDPLKKLYNGNISQTLWATNNTDKTLKNYIYTYDALNRLKTATDNTTLFNEDNILYDKNGNITKLKRKGPIVDIPSITNPAQYGLMDDLTYTYDGGNRLQIVSDLGNKTIGFKDDVTGAGIVDTSIDYTYDANGNMITDTNKGITNIIYNNLNLPIKIILSTGNIVYLYNAAGQKVQKIVTTNSPISITATDYLGGYQYNTTNNISTLKFFPTVEGYVENNSGSYKYVYQYKDHLGNVRLSYDKTLVIQEENNYYPFGLKHIGYNGATPSSNDALKYKFLGQERQDELGLNWDTFRHRNYDYAIGRFFGVDPVSEEYMSISTYQFAHNNPVWKIEIEGLEGAPSNGKQDTNNHEPVKVKNEPVLGLVGTVFKSKVVQKEVAEEVVEDVIQKGSGLSPLAKFGVNFVSLATSLLTDYMSPNYGGRTSEIPAKFGIDEKFSVKDYKVKEKTVEETGIKRFFEDNSKHGKDKKGKSGKTPENPQEVLDNDSFELPGNTTRRIGIDYKTGEFNIFDEHSEGKFHGHVRNWSELSQDMKNVLLKQKLVTKKGKIIKPEE